MFLLIDVNFFVIKVKEGHLGGKNQYVPVKALSLLSSTLVCCILNMIVDT